MSTTLERALGQTFGVEVEMSGIYRDTAARTAAAYFGTCRCKNTAHADGYDTWSAWDADGRKWKFSRDCSIVANTDGQKCEMVTPILTIADMDLLRGLIRELRAAGAKSRPSLGCGVHIHVGGGGHNAQSLRNLVNIMYQREDIIIRAINIADSRLGHYCKTVDPELLAQLNTKKPKTLDAVEDIWYKSQYADYCRGQHYNDSRYHMLNLHSFFHGHGTVEFRLFQFDEPDGTRKGGLHAGQLKAYILLALAINQAAKDARSAQPKKAQMENEKYSMRTWLLRLGFIGAEYENARENLMKRLTGDAAFRYGRHGELRRA